MAWHIMLERKTWIGKCLYGVYIPAAIAAILLTGSRGSFLAGVVATSLVLWNFARIGVRSRVLVLALALAAAGVAYTTKVPENTLERIHSIPTEIEGGRLSGRREIWRDGRRLFLAHPLLGLGAGGFPAAIGDASHNAFLSILVEDGLIGACIFAACWILLLARARRMPALERSFWLVLCLTWAVGNSSLDWGYRKPTWFILAMLTTRIGAAAHARARVPVGLRDAA
jgi:O-antigen ligase